MLFVFSSIAAALLLLCLPSAWLQRGRVQHLAFTHILDDSRLRYSLLNWVIAVDFFRAVTGAWLLKNTLMLQPDVMSGHIFWVGYINLILVAAISLQLIFHHLRPQEIHAPFGFSMGILITLMPLGVALPALVLAFATAIAARSLTVGTVILALGVLAFGLLLQVGIVRTISYSALMGLPLIGIIGSNRELMLPVTVRKYQNSLRVSAAFSSRLR